MHLIIRYYVYEEEMRENLYKKKRKNGKKRLNEMQRNVLFHDIQEFTMFYF